jgi:16S rRNA (adenine1518-N6/adenine1519-N6)-dimethyltransferase
VSRQRLGQHFLAKVSILERIARAACPDREPLVIEIGPGRGGLTEKLLEKADRVIAIEIDGELVELLREKFRDEPRLTLIQADVLETDLGQWGGAAVAGNLPYYAATPIIEKTLSTAAPLRRAVFLVQKEVAARLAAKPGTRDYGYLSVQTQLLAEVEALFDVRPSAFRPPPKVDSTLIRLQPRNRAAELRIGDIKRFLDFVKLCFHQKRKTMRNNLAGVYGKDALNGRPEAAKRAEELTLQEFAELYCRLVPS